MLIYLKKKKEEEEEEKKGTKSPLVGNLLTEEHSCRKTKGQPFVRSKNYQWIPII